DFDSFRSLKTCPVCNGAKLKKEALHFKIDQKNISELADMDVSALTTWFENLENRLSERQNIIAADSLKEIRSRLGFLLDVGFNYRALIGTVLTPAGREAQRVEFVTSIG